MKRTREQKRAALLAQVGALMDAFLDWEEGAERPNLTEIADAVLNVRARFGRVLAERAIESKKRSNLQRRRCVRAVASDCGITVGKGWT